MRAMNAGSCPVRGLNVHSSRPSSCERRPQAHKHAVQAGQRGLGARQDSEAPESLQRSCSMLRRRAAALRRPRRLRGAVAGAP